MMMIWEHHEYIEKTILSNKNTKNFVTICRGWEEIPCVYIGNLFNSCQGAFWDSIHAHPSIHSPESNSVALHYFTGVRTGVMDPKNFLISRSFRDYLVNKNESEQVRLKRIPEWENFIIRYLPVLIFSGWEGLTPSGLSRGFNHTQMHKLGTISTKFQSVEGKI